MDPNECLRLLIQAAVNGDVDGVMEHGDNLVSWLNSEGFPPNARTIRDAVSLMIID